MELKFNKKIAINTVAGLCLVLLGGLVGYTAGFYYEQKVLLDKLSIIHPIREHDPAYTFIDPLLAYIIPSSEQEAEFGDLKNKISDFITSEKKNKTLSDTSVFLSDLNRGRWVGVNEKDQYNPASMLKVVIMVAYFKEAERESDILYKSLLYTSQENNILKKDIFNASSNLQVNESYTVESLINKMIIESDNGAEILLLDNIDKNSLGAIYNALNLENPDDYNGNFVISSRAYSLFFRILYSGTYLSHDMSEKALAILSKTTFYDGIVAGLPQGTVVAHKFGEYVSSANNQIQNIELHDCGIVYYKSYPYFLCVMTKGSNLDELKSVIKNISSLVYQEYSK